MNRPWQEIAAGLRYFGVRGGDGGRCCFSSAGLNCILEIDDWKARLYPLFYDSSIGTISIGDILRFGP